MSSKYPESAKSYGLGQIPLSQVLLPKDEANLALARNAVFQGLFSFLKAGRLDEQTYRSWCDRFWGCNTELEVELLVSEFKKALA